MEVIGNCQNYANFEKEKCLLAYAAIYGIEHHEQSFILSRRHVGFQHSVSAFPQTTTKG